MAKQKADIRLAFDKAYIRDYLTCHFSRWFPGFSRLVRVDISLERNFLQEFVAIAVKYDVVAVIRGKRRTLTLRAQARATHHSQAASPKKTFQISRRLTDLGHGNMIARPLAYNSQGNFYLYEDAPGTSIERVLHPQHYRHEPAHPPHAILAYIPGVARTLHILHAIRRIPNIPVVTPSLARNDVREYFRLIRKHHPPSVAPLQSCLKRCNMAHPGYRRALYSARRRRLIHGDMHPGNFIVQGKKLILIDFGDAAMHDPLNDIGRFFVQTQYLLRLVHRKEQPDVMNDIRIAFLDHYFHATSVPPMTRFAINYFAVINLMQIMSIACFTTTHALVDRSMQSFLDGVKYYTERVQSLTY